MPLPTEPQPRKPQAIDAKRNIPAKPLPIIRDTILREIEAAGGDLSKLGDGHKFSRRDITRCAWFAVAYAVNRMVARVDGYGARIGPQSAQSCPSCGARKEVA